MTIYTLGSYNEPIVISDEEDAAYVENELTHRWIDSPTSSAYESPGLLGSTPYVPSMPSQTMSATSTGQKRKFIEAESASSGPSTHSLPDNPAKRLKKKQKDKKHTDYLAKSSSATLSQHELHDGSERLRASSWHNPGPAHHVRFTPIAVPPAHSFATPDGPRPGRPPQWPVGVERSSGSAFLAARLPMSHPHPEASWHMPRKNPVYTLPPSPDQDYLPPSPRYDGPAHGSSTIVVSPPGHRSLGSKVPGKAVSATLDDSLRRLEALSASLLSIPPNAPAPTAASGATSTPQVDSDKRRIGKFEDRTNAAYFDLTASTLDPPSSPSLPPPSPPKTVVVAHLPKKFRRRDFVESWARKFGAVVRLELDAKSGKALVEYKRAMHAEAAFMSTKLRGDGKEHIRVYWYRGSAPPAAAPVLDDARQVDEGELEEGEVVEIDSTAFQSSKGKKKKKSKKKTQPLEQRFSDRTAHSQPTPGLSPRQSSVQTSPSVVAPRLSLEERFSDAPALRDDVWEEEMDLDSENGEHREPSSTLSPPLLATVIATFPGDADVEEWEADMDLEVSCPMCPMGAPPPLPASPRRHPASPTSLSKASLPDPAEHRHSGALEASRMQLEDAARRTRSQLPNHSDASLTSASSSGTSVTPEPMTPSEVSANTVGVTIMLSDGPVAPLLGGEEPVPTSEPMEVDKPAVSLDELAISFITESIQGVVASSPQPSHPLPPPPSSALPSPPRPQTLPLPPRPPPPCPPTKPASTTVTQPTAPLPITVPSTPQLSEAAQLLAKKKRLEEYIASSKELLAKIGTAKTKQEKDMFMRLFKEKQRAMDLELQGGRASPSTPGARVATAAPTPAPKATPFRWPETPQEMIIDVSDDEADSGP